MWPMKLFLRMVLAEFSHANCVPTPVARLVLQPYFVNAPEEVKLEIIAIFYKLLQ